MAPKFKKKEPSVKSNAGRKPGIKNKPGSQKPGPKPKHLKNQSRLKFVEAAPIENKGVDCSIENHSESTQNSTDLDEEAPGPSTTVVDNIDTEEV